MASEPATYEYSFDVPPCVFPEQVVIEIYELLSSCETVAIEGPEGPCDSLQALVRPGEPLLLGLEIATCTLQVQVHFHRDHGYIDICGADNVHCQTLFDRLVATVTPHSRPLWWMYRGDLTIVMGAAAVAAVGALAGPFAVVAAGAASFFWFLYLLWVARNNQRHCMISSSGTAQP